FGETAFPVSPQTAADAAQEVIMKKTKKLLSLGLAALMVAGTLAGCGGSAGTGSADGGSSSAPASGNTEATASNGDSSNTAGSEAPADTTDDGGEKYLRVSLYSYPTDLEPTNGYYGWGLVRMGIGETLVKFDPELNCVPWLATSWEQTDDETWVFHKMKGDYWRTLESLTSCYLENINGLTTTELFNRGEDREKKLGGIATHLRDIILDVMVLNFSSTALNELLINAAIVAATIVTCVQMGVGAIGLVEALTVLMLSYGFFGSIRALQWIAHDALHGVAAAQDVADILEIDTSKPVKQDAKKQGTFEGIRFENVSFGYKGRDNVLKDVSLEIPRGKVCAIAGESGSGKSTIVNMLLRFYDAKDGQITLDGQDYLSILPEKLRRKIAMVPQIVYIFSGSIRSNLLMANENATEEELWQALDEVRLKDWVSALPEGLDAPVGDAGSRLSGGQRQRLGIARVLLSNAEYIVFDEATSSVDEENEREIWNCIGRLAQHRTLIIISHRLSTIQNADCIYLIDNGKVAEKGDHERLMRLDGKYAQLVKQQEELENIGGQQ
ncbi:MAG: ATP-binding cassette domain-containing protein, partial [Lachnospiraceae bacterium]|nr:ATP-binding cassette domain-containing protein [Lachnospiraceae bacterium]